MKKEEIESLEFEDEWLDETLNEGGNRREQLRMREYAFTKQVLESGGLEAVDAYLDATWNAWVSADRLIKVVDSFFHLTKFGTDTTLYDELVEKAIRDVFEDMILALENAETSIQYDDDPLNKAEHMIESFGYGLISDIHNIVSSDLKGEINEETA